MTLIDRIRPHGPLLSSVALSTAWTVLAFRNPERTYHLAPLAVAVAWPFVARARGGPRNLAASTGASAGGVLVALLTTVELNAYDALRGPALVGRDAAAEATILAVIGGLWGLRVGMRHRSGLLGLLVPQGPHSEATHAEETTMPTYRAIWNDTVIAESDGTIVVDGYRYFPAYSVRPQHLQPSSHHSMCGWKGQASYYDVTAAGEVNPNAAWYYPDPKPAAQMVEGRIGFWHGVRIEELPAQHLADVPD